MHFLTTRQLKTLQPWQIKGLFIDAFEFLVPRLPTSADAFFERIAALRLCTVDPQLHIHDIERYTADSPTAGPCEWYAHDLFIELLALDVTNEQNVVAVTDSIEELSGLLGCASSLYLFIRGRYAEYLSGAVSDPQKPSIEQIKTMMSHRSRAVRLSAIRLMSNLTQTST